MKNNQNIVNHGTLKCHNYYNSCVCDINRKINGNNGHWTGSNCERCFAGFIGDDCNNKDTNFIINDDNIKLLVNDWFSNKELITYIHGDISEWDVSEVTDMNRLFNNRTEFNEDISKWNVGNVTNMEGMFDKQVHLINH